MASVESSSKLALIIDDKVYDITMFKEHHPGGRGILEQYNEKDATDAFRAFHGSVGHAKLSNMKGVPVKNPEPLPERIVAYRKLRQRLIDEGYFVPNLLHQSFIVFYTLFFVFSGMYATFCGYWFLGALLVGLGYQQLGWLGHDACHHGLTPWRKLNTALGYFFGNVLNGFSVNWWKDRHNTHHAITNVLDSDPDIDNLPLFVWSKFDLSKIGVNAELGTGRLAAKMVPFQHYYFVPWTVTLKLIWSLQTLNFLLHPEEQNISFQKSIKWERGTIIAHWIIVLTLLYQTPSILAALVFFLTSQFIGGSAIALIVFMNHYACEQLQKETGKQADFVTLQLASTKNVEPGLFMDFFAGGLNYQIEHHLFPTMPRHNLPKIKPMVEQYCREHNLPYISETWSDSLSAVEVRLREIARVYVKSSSL